MTFFMLTVSDIIILHQKGLGQEHHHDRHQTPLRARKNLKLRPSWTTKNSDANTSFWFFGKDTRGKMRHGSRKATLHIAQIFYRSIKKNMGFCFKRGRCNSNDSATQVDQYK